MKIGIRSILVAVLAVMSVIVTAQEQTSAEDIAKANNPLADIKAFNVQNYYGSKMFGDSEATMNTLWLRAAAPVGRVLVRASLPIHTISSEMIDESGVGDFDIFASYMAVQGSKLSIGVGPSIAAPTASGDNLGTGKWQAGAALVAFAVPSPQLQLGGLVIWRDGFGGDEDRADVSNLAIQPFAMFQLGKGNYLRSASTSTFNLITGDYNIPLGLGVGKVMKIGGTVLNFFVEPQCSVLHRGTGTQFQVYSGLNLQFN